MLLRDCNIVNEGAVFCADVRLRKGRIDAVAQNLRAQKNEKILEAGGQYLLPGLIDDQVHFRQPGLTHKATIATDSRAAAAGGITSFMEMPNVFPPTLTMEKVNQKLAIAAKTSRINYAFYLGASTDNLRHIATADKNRIAGVKIFMGASTGNLLVDDKKILKQIFLAAPTIIATHCENSKRIQRRLAMIKKSADVIPASFHPRIRDALACFQSSSAAAQLAKETGARLHILHISTAKELSLFSDGDIAKKQITAEACVHHLLFSDEDYEELGMRLKCNPAVKTKKDRDALRAALINGKIDVIATDHAPHLLSEKELPYEQAAAGMPLAEYALPGFLQLTAGELSLTDIARLGAHNVADIFAVDKRGYIREGYFADLVLVEKATGDKKFPARKKIISKCNWTPFANTRFSHQVNTTFINGEIAWQNGKITDTCRGMALRFGR